MGQVPVLEMWFVFAHLLCSAACLLLQMVIHGVLGRSEGIPGILWLS